MRIWMGILLFLLELTLLSSVIQGQDASACQIRHSDIFISQVTSMSTLKQYHVTGIAWGFLPHPLDRRNMDRWKKRVSTIKASGLKFQARIEFDARWENMIDFDPVFYQESIMRTLDGEYLVAPWFADHRYKGSPAYWFCSNAPNFREYLKFQAKHALSGSPDLIMLDAQTSSALPLRWYAGCFCPHCLKGFNRFLESSYTPLELDQKGIENRRSFNYREFLKERGYDDLQFKRESRLQRPDIPLFREYQEYQLWAVSKLSGELSAYIDSLAGRHVPLSTSSPAHQAYRSVIIPEISHYTLEMAQETSSLQVPVSTILKYKIAEAVGKKILVTALPKQDWKLILEEERSGLVRTWIAQAYAHGANFMVPAKQWASGNKHYKGAPDDFKDLYDFIDQNRELFDGYSSFAGLSLLITHDGLRQKSGRLDSVIHRLNFENIPFNVSMVPGGWWDFELDESLLSSGDVLLLTDSGCSWWKELPRPVQSNQEGGELSITPRRNPDRPGNPVVFHLLNRKYNRDTDRVVTITDLEIQLSDSLFEDKFSGACFYRPGKVPVQLDLQTGSEGYSIRIPDLDEWGIIAFTSVSVQ